MGRLDRQDTLEALQTMPDAALRLWVYLSLTAEGGRWQAEWREMRQGARLSQGGVKRALDVGAWNIRQKYLGSGPVVGAMASPSGVRYRPHMRCSSAPLG